MYNRYDRCDCDRDRVGGIDDIKKGIDKIQEGILDIKCGLKNICKFRIREGIKCIEKGLCKIEKGLFYLMKGLKDLDYDGCSDGIRKIKEAICLIKDAIKCIKQGLCAIYKCNICKGAADIEAGLQCLEEALCKLMEALKDIMSDMDIKRKHRCDVMEEIDCRKDYMYGDRMDYGGYRDMRDYDSRMSPVCQKPDCYKW